MIAQVNSQAAKTLEFADDPRLSKETKGSLKLLNSGCAPVFVDYTCTPDVQYPQAINEIYAATKWVAEHGEEIGVDGRNMPVVGNSVGGNMTAVTTLMANRMR